MKNFQALRIAAVKALKTNYVWIIIEPTSNNAIIVDPGEAEPVINFLRTNKINPTAVFLTHHHYDHCDGAAAIKELYSIPVYGKQDGRKAALTQAVDEGIVISIPGFTTQFRVLAIPGHTQDHIAYYAPGILFCGDTLFSAGCGRLFEGTPTQMYASLQKLSQLPEETLIYCGHEYTQANLTFAKAVEPDNKAIDDYMQIVIQKLAGHRSSLPSTLKDEKNINPFLRCTNLDLLSNLEANKNLKFDTAVDVFAFLRKWKDEF